ncbi:right-handed parallel beta-helix repeat-containing protein [Sphingomonas sp. CFBP 13706]|uniref:right-handed parallel beta-helix repeat-containing protein n=1 Tax=Sphingomonas sp. CFBP 13706 TaxID=2775314 RepID=UPI0017817A36|nr:right-handed parallel beta-helix repeat-containing protein [Sphingomonas sp. CFBP 13706]MBD8736672.1 right-handed parallel beta-helix repeat-containing protein [Sphingomonas sp. CFBP 13706]
MSKCLTGLPLALAALSVHAVSAAQQLPPQPTIPVLPSLGAPDSHDTFAAMSLPVPPVAIPSVVHVSPTGADAGDGTMARPFRSIERAQQAVRRLNAAHDVTVSLADGMYALQAPLRFAADDGGRNGHVVTWQAAPGAHPVLSGGTVIAGWTLADRSRGIWTADVPRGADPRQIWVGSRMAQRAQVRAPRKAFAFSATGMTIVDPAWRFLATLPDQSRIEVEHTGIFTDRRALVERIDGDVIRMQQPGWRNNLIGYDTLPKTLAGEAGRLYFANSLAFLREPGQWFVDPALGRLYYKPREGEDMTRVEVVMPRLESLIAIAGSYDRPIADLSFSGISFRHTSWLGASTAEGYASQQSGSYLAGVVPGYPADPITTCSWGCWAFETMRNRWRQQPAAVQVAAAVRVVFEQTEFAQLGQIALGIGNNPEANGSGVGYGAAGVEVRRSRFSDLAGGAIMVGGIAPDAHHPPRPEMGVRNVVISNNRIENVSQDYKEQAAILVTYAAGTIVTHNDVSNSPYDGIDIGWGWGVNDPGGSGAYRTRTRGYYDQPGNIVYDTPTILRDTVVTGNRVHNVKTNFADGGAIYHLSADPGALIADNYIYDVPGGIGLYLDEGSRYVTVRNNVVDGVGVWLNANTMDGYRPHRTTTDNLATSNWYNGGKLGGSWDHYMNNRLVDNVKVSGGSWPSAAARTIREAGVEPEKRP